MLSKSILLLLLLCALHFACGQRRLDLFHKQTQGKPYSKDARKVFLYSYFILGNSIDQTAQLTNANRNTVGKYIRLYKKTNIVLTAYEKCDRATRSRIKGKKSDVTR